MTCSASALFSCVSEDSSLTSLTINTLAVATLRTGLELIKCSLMSSNDDNVASVDAASPTNMLLFVFFFNFLPQALTLAGTAPSTLLSIVLIWLWFASWWRTMTTPPATTSSDRTLCLSTVSAQVCSQRGGGGVLWGVGGGLIVFG